MKPRQGQKIGHKGFSYVFIDGRWYTYIGGQSVGENLGNILSKKAEEYNASIKNKDSVITLTQKAIDAFKNKKIAEDGKENSVQPLSAAGAKANLPKFKYQGVNYTKINDKWYDPLGREASSGIVERIETLSKQETSGSGKKIPGNQFTPEQMPGSLPTKTTTAEKQIQSSTGAEPVTTTTKRDTDLPVTPITTAKPGLISTSRTADDAFVNQDEHDAFVAMSGFPDINAKSSGGGNTGGGINWDDILGYGSDAIRLGLGIAGASEKLPEYKVPQAWQDFSRQMKERSMTGLGAAEKGELMRGLDTTYAYDVDNIANMSGGSAGVALGNLGRAAATRNRGVLNIGALDENVRQNNINQYGNVLRTNLDLSRMMFGDKYNRILMNKQAGAQLAADALSDISGRADFNKTYGAGSSYDDYLKALTEERDYMKDILKDIAADGFDLSNWLAPVQGITVQ